MCVTAEEFRQMTDYDKSCLLSRHVVHVKGEGAASNVEDMDDILQKLEELQIHPSLPRHTYGIHVDTSNKRSN